MVRLTDHPDMTIDVYFGQSTTIQSTKLILIKSRSGSQMGPVGLKTKSLGQILEKPCVHF